MDMPTAETPAEAYLPRSAYTLSRVAADSKAAGKQQGLDTAHGDLKATLRERDDLLEQVQKQAALFDAADEACDDDVEGFELHLLAAVGKNRDHIKYKRYFAEGLRAVTTAEPRQEEPEIVGDMLTWMAEDENDAAIGDVVKQWKPKLEASRARVIAMDEALTTTEKSLAYLKDQKLPALMAAWREEYKKLEGALQILYPSDPKRVARFFKPFRRGRKSPKPQAPTTTP